MDGSSEYNVAILIAIGTVGMLVLAISIVVFMMFYQKKMIQEQLKRKELEFDHQQRMMQAELQSQENERRRLAADLHDSIGGMLSAIRVGLSTLTRQLTDTTHVDQTKQMLDDTIVSVRRISRDLMPSTLEKFGLVQAVKEMSERFSSTSSIPIIFHESHEMITVDKKKELMLFRITQELINNAIKHAQASTISISMAGSDPLVIIVEDDGIGFNLDHQRAENRKGLGLFSIENRVHLLGAKLDFDSSRKKGSCITITVPDHNDAKT